MKLRLILYVMLLALVISACKEDDDVTTPPITIRDRTEQQVDDKATLLDYLSSHYYNSAFFETGVNHKYSDIIITELPEGEAVPSGHTLLIEAVETRTTSHLETDYEYYVLTINQGAGAAPKFTDRVRVRYEGTSISSNEVFDSRAIPQNLPLTGIGFGNGAIRAWQLIMPTFNTAESFMIGNDGITNYNNFGLGVMFVPSGLAYFSASTTGTPYDNLIFKFGLLQFEEVDHDSDGIPSYVEDLDADGEVTDDNTDEDSAANYADQDDDNDGVATIDELMPNEYTVDTNIGQTEPTLGDGEYEISRTEEAGVITIKTVTIVDTDNNMTPDYLQADITTNYNEDNDS